MEEWKEIEGWNGKYKVSPDARVWNTVTDVEVAQVLTGIPQYKYVNLRLDGKHKLVRVHRLVAEAFIENTDDLPMVDHIDRDKMNNHVSNLRWVDSSGNKRNLENNAMIGDIHLLEFVKKYEKPYAAYQHLYSSMNAGLTEQEALDRYEEFLSYGLLRRKVEWEGEEVYLVDLCETLNKPYEAVSSRLSQGWDIWNSVYEIRPSWYYSFEVMDNKGVGHWYRDNEMFEYHHPETMGVYKRLISEGCTLENILAYDGKDHLRQTVQGVTGLLSELCQHFGKTQSSVETRMGKGMTLEQALLSPPERVKKVTIDGVAGSPKYWYEYFGLDYKTTNRKKDSLKCSFEDILKHFKVDLSGKSISYTD